MRAHGLAAGAPAEAPADEELSGWFDGRQPQPRPAPGSDPTPVPSPPPPSTPDTAAPVTPSGGAPAAAVCARRGTALAWGAFPRELAVGGSALVPVQARPGRDVRDVVATLTTIAGGRRLGPPVTIAMPARGHALKLLAPAQPGRLDASLSWQERRDGASCEERSRTFRIAVVAPRAPRLTTTGAPRRLALTWGLAGRDCHALLARGLRVRVEGFGQRRDYRVARPCDGWEEPGAALPDLAAAREGERLLLTPLGDEPGLWQLPAERRQRRSHAAARQPLRRGLRARRRHRADDPPARRLTSGPHTVFR